MPQSSVDEAERLAMFRRAYDSPPTPPLISLFTEVLLGYPRDHAAVNQDAEPEDTAPGPSMWEILKDL